MPMPHVREFFCRWGLPASVSESGLRRGGLEELNRNTNWLGGQLFHTWNVWGMTRSCVCSSVRAGFRCLSFIPGQEFVIQACFRGQAAE